jgi:hypothetical protein
MVAHMLGINPGGEVVGSPIPAALLPSEEVRNRLLSRAEAELVSARMDAIYNGEIH